MNICYSGAVYNSSGYAQIRHLFIRLARRGHTVKIKPYKSKDYNVSLLYEDELRKLENTRLKKPYISITSGIAPQLVIDPEASYNIAHSMFEASELPTRWISFYNQFNEIWVPSKFCKSAYERSDLKCCIYLVPLGVDTSLYKKQKRKNYMFTFLSVGQWIDRKGWDLLIQAYTSEFMGQFDVRLCIKTYNDLKTNEEMIKEYLSSDIRSSYMPRIMIKNLKVDEKDMPEFYSEADCFVLASRGEAFGLPYLESMAMGIPVIATNMGGQTDFVNDSNGWLIEIKQLKHLSERLCKINSAYANLWFSEPDINDIKKSLRYVYEHKAECVEKGNIAKTFVLSNYDWEKITDNIEERLEQIFNKLG